MGIFQKFKSGLKKTQAQLSHELKRIISRSPKLTGDVFDEIEAALLGADFGATISGQILEAIRRAYEMQGASGPDVFGVAREEVKRILDGAESELRAEPGLTVVTVVGVNGTGKTTTAAKLSHWIKLQGKTPHLAACDTFRAAAIEQLKLWSDRLDIPLTAGAYGADAASVAHDGVSAALARHADYLIVDTAGRLHTKRNLMSELQKLHRVIGKQLQGAPHEVLLVLDGSTGMNAMNQAREFHRAVQLTGLVITKLDGTSKGGMVVPIQHELGLPIKFIGLGEQADDLQPFSVDQFAAALFAEE